MHRYAEQFLVSLKAGLSSDRVDLAKFIIEDTYLGGKPFSFKGHEYQKYVLDIVKANPGCTFVVKKSSQIGLSELFVRLLLARMSVRPGTSAVISFPSKLFAQEMLKTRVNSVIYESPRLRELINRDIDSASVKAFHNSSILFALGGSKASNTSLLNRPLDSVLADELDRQDMNIVTGFRSRMTHTPPEDRFVAYISTPTAAGLGIDAEFNECGVTHHPYTVCNHCLHQFKPDYYEHVKIPGYDESLLLLTKIKASPLPVDQAFLECPECLEPVTDPVILWRTEINPIGVKKKIGIELTPFVAHAFISMPDLVDSSLTYSSVVEFRNQGLGKVADLKDSSIQREHIHFVHQEPKPAQHIFGLDMGKLCYYFHGVINNDTSIHVLGAHVVKLSEIEEFLEEENKKNVFAASVIDSQPYSDLVYRLVRRYPRLYSAIYVSPSTPIPELFKLSMHDRHGEIVRQVSINKGPMMDLFSNSLDHFFTFEPSPMEGMIVKHLLDMRRVRDYRFEEMIYQWVKSKQGDDHSMHACVYLFTAAKLAQADIQSNFTTPTLIRKMKIRN